MPWPSRVPCSPGAYGTAYPVSWSYGPGMRGALPYQVVTAWRAAA